MANYFSEEQLCKIFTLVRNEKNPEASKLEASHVAKGILSNCSVKSIKVKDGWVVICDGTSGKEYTFYDEQECAAVEEEIRNEIKELFGLNAEVQMWLSEKYEEEPDPIPPLYMGTLDVVYVYGLIVKIKL